MAVLTKPNIPGGHWYQANGTPAHKQRTADGSGERATTLRDARRLGLYPSVTSILGILAKPGLETWKMNQVALAALANPKTDEESEQYWCRRVRDSAFDQVAQSGHPQRDDWSKAPADAGRDLVRQRGGGVRRV